MLPQHQQDTYERQDLQIKPNSCFSDSSVSLNSVNSAKVLLHLGKTPIYSNGTQCATDASSVVDAAAQFGYSLSVMGPIQFIHLLFVSIKPVQAKLILE